AGLAGCASVSPSVETVPVPQVAGDSGVSAASNVPRNRESGSAGYVVPARLDPRKHGPRRFYTGKDYGSEAEFNPLTELFNEGFDVLSLEHADRHVLTRTYGVDAHNVFNSVLHPIHSISDY